MNVEGDTRIELHYTEALLRNVVDRWWIRTVGPWLGIGLAALGTPLVFGLMHNDRSWIVGALGASLFVLWVLAYQVRAAHLRSVRKKLLRLDNGKLTLRVTDDGLAFESSIGSLLMRWNDLVEIRVNRDYWLLLRAPNDFSTLPLANLDQGLQSHLLSRFRAAGVRIRSS